MPFPQPTLDTEASYLYLTIPPPDSRAMRFRKLELETDNTIRLDGRAVDLMELRARLDLIAVTNEEWIDFRPDPEARYELFLEVLAVIKRAAFTRLRLDNSGHKSALDEGYPR